MDRGLMRRLVGVFVVLMVLLGASPASALPTTLRSRPFEGLPAGAPPVVTAESWILYDETFDRVIADHEADRQRPMASTTKMMTALLGIESGGLDQMVAVSEEAAGVGEAEIGLVPGERVRLRDLVTVLMVRSANDAAIAVAEHVARSEAGFVLAMNRRASELGLDNTMFANPHGLDAPGHYSSARDLLRLAQEGMTHDEFASAARTKTVVFPPDPEGNERIAETTNEMLRSFPGAIGVKTGFTSGAGLTLVAAAERDGRRLYAVVMGSEDHFSDASALLDYGFDEFGMVQVIAAGVDAATRRQPGVVDQLDATESVEMFLSDTEAEQIRLAPAYAGGRPMLVAQLSGDTLAAVDLAGPEPHALPGVRDAVAWASRYWDWLWGNE